jgi:hypothetical protein
MKRIAKIGNLLLDLQLYSLAALCAFLIGTYVVHWSLGLLMAVAVVTGMRALTPLFKGWLK